MPKAVNFNTIKSMKRALLLIALALFSLQASAQIRTKVAPTFKLGVKAGVNYHSNDFIGEEFSFYDIKPGTGFVAGLQADLKWRRFGVHPELLYSYIAMKSEVPQAIHKSNVKVSKIDLPVLLEYEVLGFLTFQAGPTFALYTATGGECTVWNDAKNAITAKWDFRRPPVGIAAGADVRIWKFNVAARYYKYFGKGEFDGVASGKSKMKGFQFSLGYYF